MSYADDLLDRLFSMCDVGHDLIAEIEEVSANADAWNSEKYKKYVNMRYGTVITQIQVFVNFYLFSLAVEVASTDTFSAGLFVTVPQCSIPRLEKI